jgi:hypothetical protein
MNPEGIHRMQDSQALKFLRIRAETIPFHGHDLVVEDNPDPKSDPGLFLPAKDERGDTILLRLVERTDRQILHTLCHELGHFWAYASGRRDKSYSDALTAYKHWDKGIEALAMNLDETRRYRSPGEVPRDTWEKAVTTQRLRSPLQLRNDGKRIIFEEEQRAWAFGYEIASKLALL